MQSKSEETMIIWSAEVDGDEGVMMAKFYCIYAAVSKRQMHSDERIVDFMQTRDEHR